MAEVAPSDRALRRPQPYAAGVPVTYPNAMTVIAAMRDPPTAGAVRLGRLRHGPHTSRVAPASITHTVVLTASLPDTPCGWLR
jgi:hypothetical protein